MWSPIKRFTIFIDHYKLISELLAGDGLSPPSYLTPQIALTRSSQRPLYWRLRCLLGCPLGVPQGVPWGVPPGGPPGGPLGVPQGVPRGSLGCTWGDPGATRGVKLFLRGILGGAIIMIFSYILGEWLKYRARLGHKHGRHWKSSFSHQIFPRKNVPSRKLLILFCLVSRTSGLDFGGVPGGTFGRCLGARYLSHSPVKALLRALPS